MDSLTWARNALGLRLIAMGAALADAPPTRDRHELPAVLPGDAIPAATGPSLNPSATVIAELTTANGVWPGRVF